MKNAPRTRERLLDKETQDRDKRPNIAFSPHGQVTTSQLRSQYCNRVGSVGIEDNVYLEDRFEAYGLGVGLSTSLEV